jgi:hypothetical protein
MNFEYLLNLLNTHFTNEAKLLLLDSY